MKTAIKTLVLCTFMASLLVLGSCKNQDKDYNQIPEEKELNQEELEKRGKYLVTLMGCQDCHSPKRFGTHGPEIIEELAYSGYQSTNQLPPMSIDALEKGWALIYPDITAAVGPWGVSFAANLTSHETGIGNWTFEQFKKALKEGKSKGLENGRPLLPPMPWENFIDAKDEELKAMYAFFQSTNPVENVVPEPITPDKLAAMDSGM
jgi:hypothetical protein